MFKDFSRKPWPNFRDNLARPPEGFREPTNMGHAVCTVFCTTWYDIGPARAYCIHYNFGVGDNVNCHRTGNKEKQHLVHGLILRICSSI